MRVHYDKLGDPKKKYHWVEEYWGGFSPALTYQEQHRALLRFSDSLEYVERGFEEGNVVMLFNVPDRSGIVYLVATDTTEEFASFHKTNEAHVRMAPGQRKVHGMVDWDVAKEAFLQMIARLSVRASYEKNGHVQPRDAELDQEAFQWRTSGRLAPLFERLGAH